MADYNLNFTDVLMPSLFRPSYSHRLYKDFYYDDNVRHFQSYPKGSEIIEMVLAAQSENLWLRSYAKQYWTISALSSRSSVLRCTDRRGNVLYYKYLEQFSFSHNCPVLALKRNRLMVSNQSITGISNISQVVSLLVRGIMRFVYQATDITGKTKRT